MAENDQHLSSEEIYAAPLEGILELTISANQIASSDSNPYATRNAVILQEKRRRILYKNGHTLPAAATILLNEASQDIRHSRKLSDNMHSADKALKRPKMVDAHHVVAVQEPRARESREILFFIWLIGINDAANGVYMRRFPHCKVKGFAKCPPHQGVGHIHTDVYHLTVIMRLRKVAHRDAVVGRAELRNIASEIIAGTFPY